MKLRKVTVVLIAAMLFTGLAGFEPSDTVYDKCRAQEYVEAQCEGFVGEGAGKAENVILIIGDGMGIGQTYAGRVYLKGPEDHFRWEKLPNKGLVTTCAIGHITDSAASGTAIATGRKTSVGTISSEPGLGPNPYQSIVELIDQRKATGLVTNTELWDATPAVFAAHAPRRTQSRQIAYEMVGRGLNVMLGGGSESFTTSGPDGTAIERAGKLGYKVVDTASGLEKIDPASTDKLLGLFADGSMEYEVRRKDDTTEPHLSDMAEKALSILSRDDRGFFLMIEGARIDHSGHSMDLERVVHEMKEFDRTVGLALDFAEENPNTLVIITADHETGGTEIEEKDYQKGDMVDVKWTSSILGIHANHSSQRVPIYGTGPNAAAIRTHMDNTEVFCLMKNALDVTAPE